MPLQLPRNAQTKYVLVAGHNAAVVAQATAQLAGADKVLHADAPMLANPLAENLATQVLAVAASYTLRHPVPAPRTIHTRRGTEHFFAEEPVSTPGFRCILPCGSNTVSITFHCRSLSVAEY